MGTGQRLGGGAHDRGVEALRTTRGIALQSSKARKTCRRGHRPRYGHRCAARAARRPLLVQYSPRAIGAPPRFSRALIGVHKHTSALGCWQTRFRSLRRADTIRGSFCALPPLPSSILGGCNVIAQRARASRARALLPPSGAAATAATRPDSTPSFPPADSQAQDGRRSEQLAERGSG